MIDFWFHLELQQLVHRRKMNPQLLISKNNDLNALYMHVLNFNEHKVSFMFSE